MGSRSRIYVRGIVQGVGFRPYVYRLATRLGLRGFVINTSGGVVIEVEGEESSGFARLVAEEPPPLASIESVVSEELPPAGYTSFEIRLSEKSDGEFSQVSPDIATCADCVRELFDSTDRRYLYPFINCTNCGPRYSIVKGVPYDRPLTTMQSFGMCQDCAREYADPADRRFHAQPVACGVCGPSLEFYELNREGRPELCASGPEPWPVERAADALLHGKVLAVKGLGGFHLACDATNHVAVRTLRDRKRKSRKPFALMASDVETIRRFCRVGPMEADLLTSGSSPIVVLEKLAGTDGHISPETAPGCSTLGFMLPYTPLHHLLMRKADGMGRRFDALVMTSGNIADEPLVTDNREAFDGLDGLADCWLVHDRDIHMRVDDSVARVMGGLPRVLRRARGYVPETIDLGRVVPETLACGAELKNTLTVTRDRYAVVSQHIGDLTNFETMGFFAETLGNMLRIFSASPGTVANDMHPDYLSTRFAVEYSQEQGNRPERVEVQHHHAHIAACMAENGCDGRVIGVAFDGTGHGADGNTWGSEFLIADYAGYERFAHLDSLPLPGGDAAVREPWRCGLSALVTAYGPIEGWKVFAGLKERLALSRGAEVVLRMLEKGVNCPPSCGMGRLFDAVSSLSGVSDSASYEAEAAIMLEQSALGAPDETGSYPFVVSEHTPHMVDYRPVIRAVVEDINGGVSKNVVGARFHNTVRDMAVRLCTLAREQTGLGVVALSGGVFQNALLFTGLEKVLKDEGFRVLTHSKFPPNDGCISLGQAAVAAARLETSNKNQ